MVICLKGKQVLKSFDLLGEDIKLNLNGENQVKTTIGGCLSIPLFILYFYIVYYNLKQYIYNNKPQISDHIRFKNLSEIESLPESLANPLFTFVRNTESEGNSFQKIIPYNSSFNEMIRTKNKTFYNSKGDFIECSRKQINNDFNQTLKIVNINDMLCLNITSNEKIRLGGNIYIEKKLYNILGYLKYRMEDMIRIDGDILNLLIFLNNKIIDFEDERGYKNFEDVHLFSIDKNQDYDLNLKIVKNIFETDYNVIYDFLDNDVRSFFTIKVNMIPKKKVDLKLFSIKIFIEIDPYEVIFQRTYIKFDTFLANTFSMFELVRNIFIIANILFNSGGTEYQIMKNLYKYDNSNNSNKIIYINDNSNRILDNNNLNTIVNKLLNNNDNKLSKPYYFSFYYVFGCLKRNKNIKDYFNLCMLLNNDMNIINILGKLIEYENIKEILFKQNQLNAIKLFNKRYIIDETDIYISNLDQDLIPKLNSNEKINFINYIKNIKNSSNLIDYRILNKLRGVFKIS